MAAGTGPWRPERWVGGRDATAVTEVMSKLAPKFGNPKPGASDASELSEITHRPERQASQNVLINGRQDLKEKTGCLLKDKEDP